MVMLVGELIEVFTEEGGADGAVLVRQDIGDGVGRDKGD